MAFVYRYVNTTGRVMYVGKVTKHDNLKALENRMVGHRDDLKIDERSTVWTIEFIPGLTAADADALETILIARYQPSLNTAKTKWGGTFAFDLRYLPRLWQDYRKVFPRRREYSLQKTPAFTYNTVSKEIDLRTVNTCPYCGRIFKQNLSNKDFISSLPAPGGVI